MVRTDSGPDAPAIDLLDPATFAGGQPHELFAWMRTNQPVYWHAEPDGAGFWAVTRHADVRFVGRNPEIYSSSPTIMIPDSAGALEMTLGHQMFLTMDPPRHSTYRRVVSRRFTPRAVAALQARIEELACDIVDAVIERGTCDLVADIAGEMPSFVIAELMGIPLDDGRRLYQLTETIHAAPESVPEGAGMMAVMEMFNYAHSVAEEKRRTPGDDLSSLIVHSDVEGQTVDDIDFNLFFLLLVDAGGDTTRNLLAGGMQALFDHPEAARRLHDDLDGLLPRAMEEMLRWVSPVIYMRRRATVDTELAGQAIRAGDKVVMYYGAANRDPDAFADPGRFDPSRTPNDHLAFGGGGPHFCMGAHLARLETTALLRQVLTRMPDMEPAGAAEWLASTFISGPRTMPVRFTPGRRVR